MTLRNDGGPLGPADDPPDWTIDWEPNEAPQIPKTRPFVPYLRDPSAVAIALEAHERHQRALPRRLRFGLPGLDDLLVGMIPGAMTVIVARSSGGKTSAIYNLAHQACRGIAKRDRLDREVVVVLSGEDTFDDIARFVSTRPTNPSAPLVALDKYRRGGDGVIVVGGKALTLNEMLYEVDRLVRERGLEVAGIFADYAGVLPVDDMPPQEANRIALFDRTSELLIGAARAYDCPAVLGAQANRTAHGGAPKADSVYGGDVLFHHANCMFSLFSCGEDPDAKGDDHHVFVGNGRKIARIEGSVWLQVLKNRGGRRVGCLLNRDPETRFFDYEYRPEEYRV